ncbi:MAG: hypothetical protein IKT56_03435 [Clostridia bacterium]|nr:hypothetical protein [Clostridia bacterium]
MSKKIIISNIKKPFDADDREFIAEAKLRVKRAGLDSRDFDFRIYKKAIDARHRDNIMGVCSVSAQTTSNISFSSDRLKKYSISEAADDDIDFVCGKEKLPARPVVVGFGPAGIFCALLLAENGYAPIVIERGASVEDRVRLVDEFYRNKVLDANTNIQFGAGGAGTFSDGKLVTRISDKKCSYVIKRLHEFGAPDEIMYRAKPHIGTDNLRVVVQNAANRIKECGGEIRYNTRLDDIKGYTAKTSDGEINCGVIVLALGHSARDTYKMLMERDFNLEAKPFSVGVRIEHLQSDIDKALFGKYAGHSALGKGEYSLSDTTGERGVYTFCMCPGGEVVAAASEQGGVVVNGMSRYARDGKNANSAVAVSINKEDYGSSVEGAIEFQRRLERAAFEAAGADYSVPVQTFGDFIDGKALTEPHRIMPTYMGGGNFKIVDLGSLLPRFVTSSLKRGITGFERKIEGFSARDAVLSGFETRTSAPLRILRDENMCAIGRTNVYPCGEGAGYAGGITSAAVDGIRVALAIMSKYAPMNDI